MFTELKREIQFTILVEDFNKPFSIKYRTSRHNSNKKIENLNSILNQLDQVDTYIEHYPQQQQNIPSFRVHMEYSPGQNICQTTKQVSINLRRLKPYKLSSPTTMKQLKNNRRKNKKAQQYVEIKQHTLKTRLIKEREKMQITKSRNGSGHYYQLYGNFLKNYKRIQLTIVH